MTEGQAEKPKSMGDCVFCGRPVSTMGSGVGVLHRSETDGFIRAVMHLDCFKLQKVTCQKCGTIQMVPVRFWFETHPGDKVAMFTDCHDCGTVIGFYIEKGEPQRDENEGPAES